MTSNYENQSSLGRMVTAQDVANTVLFITSEAGHNINGQALAVDGHTQARVFARAGCEVRLWDGDKVALKQAWLLVEKLAEELQHSGLVDDAVALMSDIR